MPVPRLLPPVGAAYQLIVPQLVVALSETDPVPQRLFGVVVLILGMEITVARTEVLEGVVHPLSEAST